MAEPRPWPLRDLLEKAGVNQSTLAEIVGVDPATVSRHLMDGLTLDEADRWSMKVGLHPSMVWDEWTVVDDETPDLFEFL